MLIIGHRGAKGLAPENTIAALQAAIDSKVDMIEFDVRTTKDHMVVIHHDPDINGLDIAKTDFTDLKAAMPNLTSLHVALNYISGRCPVIIEVKKGSDVAVVIEVLNTANLSAHQQVASFNMPILKALRAAFPDMQLVVLEKWSGVRASYRARKLHTDLLCMNQLWLWSGFIRAMSKRGYKLIAYSLNNPKKAKRWAVAGLYGAVTDYPDKLK